MAKVIVVSECRLSERYEALDLMTRIVAEGGACRNRAEEQG
jgi:hypothetical protein